MTKKYTINEDGRIVALRAGVRGPIGTVGGFVESEQNLSHEGDCWVYVSGKVSGNGKVFGDGEGLW